LPIPSIVRAEPELNSEEVEEEEAYNEMIYPTCSSFAVVVL
jgi:hypothetical protein